MPTRQDGLDISADGIIWTGLLLKPNMTDLGHYSNTSIASRNPLPLRRVPFGFEPVNFRCRDF